MDVAALVFVGMNARVAALDRATGQTVWTWRAEKPSSGYVTLLLEPGLLVASVNGYTYGLDPLSGRELWFNDLPGFGVAVASLASVNGTSGLSALLAAASSDAEQSQNTMQQTQNASTPPAGM